MNVRELIAKLQALSEEEKELPVCYLAGDRAYPEAVDEQLVCEGEGEHWIPGVGTLQGKYVLLNPPF